MSKKQRIAEIHEAIGAGTRLSEEQVSFAGKQGICLWGSVNYEERENSIRNSAEYKRISRMTSVVDTFDLEAYQKAIYSNGWNS